MINVPALRLTTPMAPFLLGLCLLFTTTERLPAPISEPKPEETITKPKTAAANRKSIESSDSNSARRFNGTWKGTFVDNTNVNGYIYSYSAILIIKDGKTADLTSDKTATLPPRGWWGFLQAAHRHLSPLSCKNTNNSDHLVADGFDLMIRWSGPRLIDWAPKTLPLEEAQKLARPQTANKPSAFTLKGDELAGSKTIYDRAK